MKRSSLSAGLFIPALLDKAGVEAPVYPAVVPMEATLPYIVYARKAYTGTQAKGSGPSDSVTVSVWCSHSGYEESVELAESVREAVEGKTAVMDDGLRLRCARLEDSTETYSDDAYTQYLEFTLQIN